MRQINTQAARDFSNSGERYTGAEVRLWLHDMCDEIDRLRRPPTPTGYSDTDWTKALADAKEAGWQECMEVWAAHMRGMAHAVGRMKRP